MMGDLLFIICSNGKVSNMEHNRLILRRICHIVEALSTVMDLRAHGYLFRSALQAKTWSDLPVREVKDV